MILQFLSFISRLTEDRFLNESFRRNQFNFLVYGRERPYSSKNKKIIVQTFGLFFYSMIFTHYFLSLDKIYNNQNQEGFIICQKQQLKLFCKRGWSQKFQKIYRKTPLLETLFNKIAGLYACCVNIVVFWLHTVEYFYTNKTDFFFSYH